MTEREQEDTKDESDISKLIHSSNSETTTILVAQLPFIIKSVLLLLRLKESVPLGNLAEIPTPVSIMKRNFHPIHFMFVKTIIKNRKGKRAYHFYKISVW